MPTTSSSWSINVGSDLLTRYLALLLPPSPLGFLLTLAPRSIWWRRSHGCQIHPPPHPPPKLRPTIWPSCHLFHPNEENTSRWRRQARPNATMTMIEGAYRPEDLGTLDWRRGRSTTAVAVGSVVVVVHTSISFYMWCWFGFLSCWSVHIYLWVCTSMCIDLWNIDVYLDLMIWTFGIDLGMRLCIDLNELARINLFLCSSSTS